MSFEIEKSPQKEASNIDGATSATTSSSDSFDQRPVQLRKYSLQQSINSGNQIATDNNVAQRQTSDSSSSSNSTVQAKPNNTGLPDNLKSGIENLSGMSMDDVKVHANSSKPAQVGAHAYAQGSDIHLASGQEKHLPHEAWHTVQQKQGRVQPTTEVNGVAVNDNTSLESEADVMGSKAMQMKANDASPTFALSKKKSLADTALQPKKIVQRVEDKEEQKFGGIIKHTLFVLEGESSWVGWLTNSTFTQLKNKIKEYEKASLGQRALLLNDIYDLGVQWYEKHKYLETGKDKDGNPASENETRKLVSVRGIVDAIRAKRQKRAERANEAAEKNKPSATGADTSVVKEVEESEDLQLGRSEDKVGLIAKAKAMLTGKESTFMKIDRLFSVYTGYHNLLLPNSLNFDKKTVSNLKELVVIADELKLELHNWREKHHRVELPKSEEKADEPLNKTLGDHLFYAATRPLTLLPERFGVIESFTNWWNKDFDAKFNFIKTVEANFGYLDLDLRLGKHQNVHFVAKGLALDKIFSDKHSNAFVEVDLPNNKATANGVNFLFTDAGIALESDIELDNVTNIEHYKDVLGFNIDKATISKNLDQIDIDTGLDLDVTKLNYVNSSTITGKATSTYAFEVGAWTDPSTTFGLSAGIEGGERIWTDTFSVNGGKSEAKKVSNSFTVFTKPLEFKEVIPTVTLDSKGFNWAETSFVHQDDSLLTKFLTLANVSFSSSGFSSKYARKVTTSNVKFNTEIGEITAALSNGSLTISNDAAKNAWKIQNVKLDLDFTYKNYFNLNAKNVDYNGDANELSITETNIKLLDGLPGQLNGSTAKINDLVITKDLIDWKLITLNNPTENKYSPFGDTFSVTAPDTITVEGKKEDYKSTLEGTTATLDTKYFNAVGSANFSITKKSVAPAIESARLKFAASSPTMPPTINGIWPIDLTYPIPVGPFPFEVTAGFVAKGGFNGNIKGDIKYNRQKKSLILDGKANLNGELSVGAELGVNAGSSFIVAAGVYGGAYTTLTTNLFGGLDGRFTEADGQFTLDTLNANYGISASAKLDLKLGAKVTALYFFKKTIYETTVATWEFGELNRKGTYNFISSDSDKNKDKVKESNTSVLLGGKQSLPKYPATNKESNLGKGLKASSEGEVGYSAVDAAKKSISDLLNNEEGKVANAEQIENSKLALKKAILALTKKANSYERGWFTSLFNIYQDSQKIADKSKLIIQIINTDVENLSKYINTGKVSEVEKLNKNILIVSRLLNKELKPEDIKIINNV